MAAEAPPVGFLELYSIAGWREVDLKFFWVLILVAALFLALSTIDGTGGVFQIISLGLAIMSLAAALASFLGELRPLRLIAVNLGHPWIEEEHDMDLAEVALRTSKEKWLVLSGDSGMTRLKGDSRELVLHDDDAGTPLMVFSSKRVGTRTVHWLNTALALRDAQNSSAEDPIEEARDREQQESIMLQREWDDTSAGQFDIRPGILFRGFSGALKDEKRR